jgi:cysteine-rich CPCC protein
VNPIQTIREHIAGLRFESPSRGAVVLARLKWGLPASETVPGVSELDAAMAIIQRTIVHSHRTHHGLDQYGNGSWAMFSRHVSEDDARWDFEVDVAIDRGGQLAITDVRVVRPDDDKPDPDDPDAEPAVEPRTPLTDADLLPHGMLACPCCGHATLSERAMYQICPVCFWEDDGQDSADAAVERGGPNKVSLARARANYLAFGANAESDREHVRRPTREEVQLRRFTTDGSEP